MRQLRLPASATIPMALIASLGWATARADEPGAADAPVAAEDAGDEDDDATADDESVPENAPHFETVVHAEDELEPGRAGSRVTRQNLQERLPRSAPDALRFEPGVFVQQTAASQGSAFVRGRTGQQTVLLFDGIRLNNSLYRQGPNQYFFTLDADTLRAIDVVRGSASVRHGSDAIGGAIDARPMEPPPPDEDGGLVVRPGNVFGWSSADDQIRERFQLEARWGDFGLIGGIGGRTVGLLEGGGAVLSPATGEPAMVPRLAEDGRTQLGTGFDELAFDGRLAWDLGGDRRLTAAVYGYRQYDAPRTDQCPPAYAAWNECLRYDEQFRTLAYAAFRGDLVEGAAEDAHLAASYQRQHERRTLSRPSSFVESGGRDDADTYGLTASARTREFPLSGGVRLALRYGGDVYHDRVASAAWITFTDTAQTVIQSRGQYLDGSSYTWGGIFAEPTFVFRDELTLGLGARLALAGAVAPADPASGTEAIDALWVTPVGRASIGWDPAEWVSVRINADHAFRAPNLDDLTSRQQTGPGFQFENPDLGAEQALTLEAGVSLRFDWLRAEAWGYWTPMWDAVARAPRTIAECPESSSSCRSAWYRYQLVNLDGRSDLFGVEAAALADLPWGFSLRATVAWAWGDGPNPAARPDDPSVPYEERVPLSRIPPLNGTVELKWRSDFGLYAGAALRWATLQDRLALQDLSDPRIPTGGTPGFAVVDLSAGWRWGDRFLLGLLVENVGDAAYRYHGSSVNGAGIGASIRIEVAL